MAIDAYALCPGGRNKKIKFCCPKQLDNLNKLQRQIESKQYGAAIQLAGSLLDKEPDCACLAVFKIETLLMDNRFEEAMQEAKSLYEREPDNCVANAFRAQWLVMEGDEPKESLDALMKSVAIAPKDAYLPQQTFEAILPVTNYLLRSGHVFAAYALGSCGAHVTQDTPFAERLIGFYSEMLRSQQIPVPMRDVSFMPLCPENNPLHDEYFEAVALFVDLEWPKALEKLESLADRADQFPMLWQAIGCLRGALLDREGAIEALRRCAKSDARLIDRVEARTLAMMLEDEPLGDQIDFIKIEYEVTDFDRALELLLSDPQTASVPFDQESWDPEQRGPMPKNLFLLLDRAQPTDDAEITQLDQQPRVIARAMCFGKETDRPARLDLTSISETDREPTDSRLRELLGENLGQVLSEDKLSRSSKTYRSLFIDFYSGKPMPRARLQELSTAYHEKYLTEMWVDQPLGLLDGKTPGEAAADPDRHVDLLAALMLIRFWVEQWMSIKAIDQTIAKLNLPPMTVDLGEEEQISDELEQLEQEQSATESAERQFEAIGLLTPLKRRYIDLKSLSGNQLMQLESKNAMIDDRVLSLIVADEILGRDDVSPQIRLTSLSVKAMATEDIQERLSLVRQAKREAEAAQFPDGIFDMMELQCCLLLGDRVRFEQLFKHVYENHMDDEAVSNQMQHMMMSLQAMQQEAAQSGMPRGASPGMAQPAADDSAGLWTPEGGASASDSEDSDSGGSKLWTPGMD